MQPAPADRQFADDGRPGEAATPVRALRVPEITAYFRIIKGLSTALGESTSDYLVRVLMPVPAVSLGFLAFAGALILQFSMGSTERGPTGSRSSWWASSAP